MSTVILANIDRLRSQLDDMWIALHNVQTGEQDFLNSLFSRGRGGIVTILEMLALCKNIVRDGNQGLLDAEVVDLLSQENCDIRDIVALFGKKLGI